MTERKTLGSYTRQVKIDGTHHCNEQRESRWSREKAERETDSPKELGIIVNGGPQLWRAWQEPKVGLDDVVDESLKLGCSKISRPDASF